jgi:hypothetical protein
MTKMIQIMLGILIELEENINLIMTLKKIFRYLMIIYNNLNLVYYIFGILRLK